jgi:hypothetical protein
VGGCGGRNDFDGIRRGAAVVWPLAWTRGGGEEEGHALAGLGRRHAKGKESGVGHSGTRFKGGRWRGEKGRGHGV